MSATTLYSRSGALLLPVTEADVAETYAALDPGRDILLGVVKKAIEVELGAAWNSARTNTALGQSDVVADTWPGRPSPELMRARKALFPLLCVYRTGNAQVQEHTFSIDKITQNWGVDYILGPLAIDDERRLGDILVAVAKVVSLVIKRRGHPQYNDGALLFGTDQGGFAWIAMTGYEVGAAKFGGGEDDVPTYLMVSVTLQTTEHDEPREDSEGPLLGATFSLGSGTKEILPDVVVADTETVTG